MNGFKFTEYDFAFAKYEKKRLHKLNKKSYLCSL